MFFISEISNLNFNDNELANQNVKSYEVFSKPVRKPQLDKIK